MQPETTRTAPAGAWPGGWRCRAPAPGVGSAASPSTSPCRQRQPSAGQPSDSAERSFSAAQPIGIHFPFQHLQAEGITLQTPFQHSDRHYQQLPYDPLGFPQSARRRLDVIEFKIAKSRFAAEESRIAPYPIRGGLSVADQVPGLLN
jgi:hypothetical protein